MSRIIDADVALKTFCAECNHTIRCEDCDTKYHLEDFVPSVDEDRIVTEYCRKRNLIVATREVFVSLPKWVSCSELMPDPLEYVLCCTQTKAGRKNLVIGYHDGERWCCGMNSNVIAWMGLPEPYGGTDDIR